MDRRLGADARGAGVAPVMHGLRTLARVSSSPGHFVFETPGGTVVQPRTPGLSAALGALRMGELVVDDKVAREILSKFEEADKWMAQAEEAGRSSPQEAAVMSLPQLIAGYREFVGSEREALDRIKAKAQTALIIQKWQSAPDKDLETLDTAHRMARGIYGTSRGLQPAPAPGTRPAPPPPPAAEGMSTIAKVGLGAAAAAATLAAAALVVRILGP
jgi:hypothetical protein